MPPNLRVAAVAVGIVVASSSAHATGYAWSQVADFVGTATPLAGNDGWYTTYYATAQLPYTEDGTPNGGEFPDCEPTVPGIPRVLSYSHPFGRYQGFATCLIPESPDGTGFSVQTSAYADGDYTANLPFGRAASSTLLSVRLRGEGAYRVDVSAVVAGLASVTRGNNDRTGATETALSRLRIDGWLDIGRTRSPFQLFDRTITTSGDPIQIIPGRNFYIGIGDTVQYNETFVSGFDIKPEEGADWLLKLSFSHGAWVQSRYGEAAGAAPVPEPAAFAMLALGLVVLGFRRQRLS